MLNARRIELGTKLILLHVWAKVIRRVQQPHSFHDSTCAIEPTDTPPPQNSKKCQGMYNIVQRDFHFLVRQKSRPPFLPKTANIIYHGDLIPENGLEAANTFLSQPQKSPDISLLQGFLRHGEFRVQNTKENYNI